MSARISVQAGISRLVAPSIGAFVLVELLLFVLTRVATLLSLLAFGVLSMLVAGGFAAEIIRWQVRGIRFVELDEEVLTLYRGPGLELRQVQRQSVRGIRISSRLGRRTARIDLNMGKAVRIRGDAFPDAPFERFCAALAAWK